MSLFFPDFSASPINDEILSDHQPHACPVFMTRMHATPMKNKSTLALCVCIYIYMKLITPLLVGSGRKGASS